MGFQKATVAIITGTITAGMMVVEFNRINRSAAATEPRASSTPNFRSNIVKPQPVRRCGGGNELAQMAIRIGQQTRVTGIRQLPDQTILRDPRVFFGSSRKGVGRLWRQVSKQFQMRAESASGARQASRAQCDHFNFG